MEAPAVSREAVIMKVAVIVVLAVLLASSQALPSSGSQLWSLVESQRANVIGTRESLTACLGKVVPQLWEGVNSITTLVNTAVGKSLDIAQRFTSCALSISIAECMPLAVQATNEDVAAIVEAADGISGPWIAFGNGIAKCFVPTPYKG